MISTELQSNLLDGIQALQHALNELREAAKADAGADFKYRQAKARAYIEFATDGEKRTVDHLKAMVDVRCEKEMWGARLASANRETAKEAVLTHRQQLSAYQSILGTYREEAAATRYGQGAGA